ncbi:MAG: cysteinyl-tRNA synthetase [Patescibacteria group bacterium]|nr:cysteinyl-tRNA synthetase [Patescibacteria group bacterium]
MNKGKPSLKEIKALLSNRSQARKQKNYQTADKIRQELEKRGYEIRDEQDKSVLINKDKSKILGIDKNSIGLLAVFGSGETSPTGRRIHEYLIKDKKPPVKIALLETPAGFEENPDHWYGNLAQMLEIGLAPFQPKIRIVTALRKDGVKSTNNSQTLAPLLTADYIHTGAGSPTYAVCHLKESLAYSYLINKLNRGTVLSFASAAAVAMGEYCLPVYEIYKAGHDPYWEKGLNFFQNWGLNLTIVPHWNNQEGGREIDTSRCFMGKKRFAKLLKMLPVSTIVLGIDEQTAVIFDLNKRNLLVMGIGNLTVLKKSKTTIVKSGKRHSLLF